MWLSLPRKSERKRGTKEEISCWTKGGFRQWKNANHERQLLSHKQPWAPLTTTCRPSNLLSSCYFGKEFPQSWLIFSSEVSSDWMINRCRKRLWQKYRRPSELVGHLWLTVVSLRWGHFFIKGPFWRIRTKLITSSSTGHCCSVYIPLHLVIVYIIFVYKLNIALWLYNWSLKENSSRNSEKRRSVFLTTEALWGRWSVFPIITLHGITVGSFFLPKWI